MGGNWGLLKSKPILRQRQLEISRPQALSVDGGAGFNLLLQALDETKLGGSWNASRTFLKRLLPQSMLNTALDFRQLHCYSTGQHTVSSHVDVVYSKCPSKMRENTFEGPTVSFSL